MWDGFVDCVRKYTTAFLTLEQQKEFEKAIKPSMESIHQLCIQDESYQSGRFSCIFAGFVFLIEVKNFQNPGASRKL